MQDENHTILISSYILSDVEKIADYIAFKLLKCVVIFYIQTYPLIIHF